MDGNLGPQFLFHGTAQPIKGDKILPAVVHGGHSYWDDYGTERGEASREHAWAHPDENVAWTAASDRVNNHFSATQESGPHLPRGRVYALHPNAQQSPGHDKSMAGEIKAPEFDIAHPVDIKPGHQGTFPEINWNEHVHDHTSRVGNYEVLPGEEDANHPTHLSVQFGHRAGMHGNPMEGDPGEPHRAVGHLQQAARDEDLNHYIDRANAVGGALHQPRAAREDVALPGMSDPRALRQSTMKAGRRR